MKIRKTEPSVGILGKIVNLFSNSTKDTYSCDYINKLNEYSTDEQVIGTWIDGKPLYRKVISKTFDVVTTEDYPLTIHIDLDFDKIINMHTIYETPTWCATDTLLSTSKGTLNNHFGKWVVSKTAKNVTFYGTLPFTDGITIDCVMEYTKTTD